MGTITLGNISTGLLKQYQGQDFIFIFTTISSPAHCCYCSPAFLLCWWPYAVIFVRGTFMRTEEGKKATGKLLYNMVIPAYLNSLINPLLYIALKDDVKEELKNLILCRNTAMARQSTRGARQITLLPRERENI